MTKNKDPFGFFKAINFKKIDNLENDKLDELALLMGIDPSDCSDDKADLKDLAEKLENN